MRHRARATQYDAMTIVLATVILLAVAMVAMAVMW
jgi:hypothetical protein